MNESLVFGGCFLFLWLKYVWETYLSYRQHKVYVATEFPPEEVEGLMDRENFRKSRLYKIDSSRFNFVSSAWDMLETSVILLCGFIPTIWRWSGEWTYQFESKMGTEILQSMIFLVISSVLSTIVEIPWKIYGTFVIEERHGFNKQTLGFFFKDQLKKLLISLLIGCPVASLLIWIIQVGGDYFFLYVWIFMTLLTLFLMTIYPEFIAPLFDKYTPLPEGELRSKIESLADRLKFPLKKLYVVEGSKRSAHSNAYMYGFWNNKRIVLYDTLIESYSPLNDVSTQEEQLKKGCKDDEIVAVLGHELGHWALHHTIFHLIVSEVNLFFCFFFFGYLYKTAYIYSAFGFATQPTLIGLVIIFQFIFGPYQEVLSFILTVVSRRIEFAADRFGAELGYARLLTSALIKLGRDNLSFPVDDWLYSAWHHSHPPVLERVRVLKELEQKDKKEN